MNNKSVWILFAIAAFLLCVVLGMTFYRDYEVFTKGKICKVVLKSLPNGDQTKGGFIYFYKDNQIYYKKVTGNYGILHHVGDTIELKYLERFKNHFLFENENPIYWGLFTITMIFSCGLGCIYYASKKESPAIRFSWQKKD